MHLVIAERTTWIYWAIRARTTCICILGHTCVYYMNMYWAIRACTTWICSGPYVRVQYEYALGHTCVYYMLMYWTIRVRTTGICTGPYVHILHVYVLGHTCVYYMFMYCAIRLRTTGICSTVYMFMGPLETRLLLVCLFVFLSALLLLFVVWKLFPNLKFSLCYIWYYFQVWTESCLNLKVFV